MVKREEKKVELKSSQEAFGIIGLTLGVLSIIMVGSNGIIMAIVGLIFSIMQQKKNPTKIGKAGIIVNIVSIIVAIIFIIVLIKYLAPILQQQLSQLNIPTTQ